MRTAICLMVRNEARDLAEWFAYHAALGFDAFFIYENLSDDGTPELLRRARKVWDVRVRRWTLRNYYSQLLVYNDCLLTQAWGFDWVLFIDADELFTPMQTDNVKSFLAPFGDATAIAVNWAFYGTSGHDDYPNALMTEAFTHRAPDTFEANQLCKSFVRPGTRLCKSPHYFPGFGRYMHASGKPVVWGGHPGRVPEIDLSAARITHYFTRSKAHWRAKVARGYPHVEAKRHEQFRLYDRNDIEDLSAARFGPALRAELERLARV